MEAISTAPLNLEIMKFKQIVLSKLDSEYYNMEVFDANDAVIYKATISTNEAFKVIEKYNNVKIK